jgi:hypothetical protein
VVNYNTKKETVNPLSSMTDGRGCDGDHLDPATPKAKVIEPHPVCRPRTALRSLGTSPMPPAIRHRSGCPMAACETTFRRQTVGMIMSNRDTYRIAIMSNRDTYRIADASIVGD